MAHFADNSVLSEEYVANAFGFKSDTTLGDSSFRKFFTKLGVITPFSKYNGSIQKLLPQGHIDSPWKNATYAELKRNAMNAFRDQLGNVNYRQFDMTGFSLVDHRIWFLVHFMEFAIQPGEIWDGLRPRINLEYFQKVAMLLHWMQQLMTTDEMRNSQGPGAAIVAAANQSGLKLAITDSAVDPTTIHLPQPVSIIHSQRNAIGLPRNHHCIAPTRRKVVKQSHTANVLRAAGKARSANVANPSEQGIARLSHNKVSRAVTASYNIRQKAKTNVPISMKRERSSSHTEDESKKRTKIDHDSQTTATAAQNHPEVDSVRDIFAHSRSISQQPTSATIAHLHHYEEEIKAHQSTAKSLNLEIVQCGIDISKLETSNLDLQTYLSNIDANIERLVKIRELKKLQISRQDAEVETLMTTIEAKNAALAAANKKASALVKVAAALADPDLA